MKKSCFLSDDIYLRHITDEYHPESPERLSAIRSRLEAQDWFSRLLLVRACPALPEQVMLAHDPAYIDLVKYQCQQGFSVLSTGDTVVSSESYEVALHAVGGLFAAVDAIFTGQVKNGFCALRPPGHHATEDRGMGFCIFNNIALAARYAQKKYGVERILIADWDVHHGNGTQDIFYEDPSVFFMSTHQSPWYPGTGAKGETGRDKGKGFTMNRPFWSGAGNQEIISAFSDEFLPAARDFKPDFTLISAGFDSHRDDPLGGFRIDDDGFRQLTSIMLEIAEIAGQGRLLSVLEGGYNLVSLSSAVAVHLNELTRA